MNVAINYPATTSGKDTSISLFGHFVSGCEVRTTRVTLRVTDVEFDLFTRGSIHQGRFSNISRGKGVLL